MQNRTPPFAAPPALAPDPGSVQGEASGEETLWLDGAIRRLVDTAPSLGALRKHRLHLAAARLWRARGRDIPADLVSQTRTAAAHAMFARLLLRKARSAYDGPLMLMKGPEVAAHYPIPSDRPFRDLDLLVEDAEDAQRALIAAGFVEFGDPAAYADKQHLPPLIWPGAPVVIEVHRRPSQPFWLAPVTSETLFHIAVPSATGLCGILAPDPAAHALLVVAHAWNHDPLGSVGHLLDAVALLRSADQSRASALAQAWGWEKMWNTTLAATDGLLGTGRQSLALKLWARHLVGVRERLVLENHLSRLAAPMWSLSSVDVPRALAWALRYTASPGSNEDWMTQLRRARLAVAHAFTPGSEHEQSLSCMPARSTPIWPPSSTVYREAKGAIALSNPELAGGACGVQNS